MDVAVIVNGAAGYADRALIESSVTKALFRCRLRFHHPPTPAELQDVIVREASRAEVIVICGGDGTLNTAVQPLMKARAQIERFPVICALPVGTANDLARELGISSSIERAARLVLEGEIRRIDVLEVEADDGRKAYMITNGGLGLPAETADVVNEFRQWVIGRADCDHTKPAYKPFFRAGKDLIKAVGPKIYEITLAGKIASWNANEWSCEIEIEGHDPFVTRAPFIMINNQKGLGAHYTPAPLTYNADGTFNLMLLTTTRPLTQLKALLDIRRGLLPDEAGTKNFEVRECTIRARPGSRSLVFFGDGEILHRGARVITVRCLPGELPIFVKGSAV